MTHLLLMITYAFIISVFFAVLSRRTLRQQRRLFLTLFASLVLGAVAVGWLMFFFPAGPPAPVP